MIDGVTLGLSDASVVGENNRRADALGFVLGLVVGAPVGLVIDNSIVIVS